MTADDGGAKLLVDRYFDAYLAHASLEDDVTNALLTAAGADPHDTETWMCEDFIFDFYDSSFEFLGTKDGWEPTQAMEKAWKGLGFVQCWISYSDGRHGKREKHYAF